MEIKNTNQKFYGDIDPVEEKSLKSKIDILNEINSYARSKDSSVKQVTANFIRGEKNVEILRAGGQLLKDERPLVRFNVSIMVEKTEKKKQVYMG